MSKRLTTEEFISRSNIVHDNFYDYSDTIYIKSHDKVKIKCPIHGIFEQRPDNHLKGQGCKECYNVSKPSTTEDFIKKSIDIHGNIYDYSDTIYIKSHDKVKIKCPIHGLFKQTPHNHLKGHGCLKCSNNITKERFIEVANGEECTFYIIKCFDSNESFYKVGITSRKLKHRFSGNKMPYNYEILKEIKSDAETVWNIENILKVNLKSSYKPCIDFDGSLNECFTSFKEIENNLKLFTFDA